MIHARIEVMGPADDVLRRPLSAYTRTLLAAVPRIERVPRMVLPTD